MMATALNAGSTPRGRLEPYKKEIFGMLCLTAAFIVIHTLFLLGLFAKEVPLSEHKPFVVGGFKALNSSPYGVTALNGRLVLSYPSLREIVLVDVEGRVLSRVKVERGLTSLATFKDLVIGVDPLDGRIVRVEANGSLKPFLEESFVNPVSLAVKGEWIIVYDSYIGALFFKNTSSGDVRVVRLDAHLLGIDSSDEGLWAIIAKNQTMALLSWDGLRPIKWLYVPTSAPYDLAWDGKHVWVTDYIKMEVIEVDPARNVYVTVGDKPPSWLPVVYVLLLLPFLLSMLSKKSSIRRRG